MHHLDQLLRAPAALDEVADAARLVVRDDHLLGVLGVDESAVELRDRQQLLLLHRDDDAGREAVGPLRVGLSLFVNRQPFGEPARHAVVGGGEHEHVVHLVPERAGPVERAGRAARRTVHRDDSSERHAERAETGHTHRADGEVLVIGIDLHLHRPGKRHLVLALVGVHRPRQHALDVRLEQIGFLLVELERGLDARS